MERKRFFSMALDRSVFVISLTTYSFSDLSLCVVVVVFLQLWFIAALTVCDLDAIKTPDRRRIDVRELDRDTQECTRINLNFWKDLFMFTLLLKMLRFFHALRARLFLHIETWSFYFVWGTVFFFQHLSRKNFHICFNFVPSFASLWSIRFIFATSGC